MNGLQGIPHTSNFFQLHRISNIVLMVMSVLMVISVLMVMSVLFCMGRGALSHRNHWQRGNPAWDMGSTFERRHLNILLG